MDRTFRVFAFSSLLAVLFSAGALAEGSAGGQSPREVKIGSFANDAFGDGHDRWQTGSYQRSWIVESGENRAFERRFRAQIVSPWNPREQAADRPYSTLLAVGAYWHRLLGRLETRHGFEVALVGKSNGLAHIQTGLHNLIGYEGFDPLEEGIEWGAGGLRFIGEAEVAYAALWEKALVRPYALASVGADQSVSLGIDIVLGPHSQAKRWTRDAVTGRLLQASGEKRNGLSLVAGIDRRKAWKSVHLPEGGPVSLNNYQTRARLGLQFESGKATVFIGQAWLSEEFTGQSEHQRIGLISVNFTF